MGRKVTRVTRVWINGLRARACAYKGDIRPSRHMRHPDEWQDPRYFSSTIFATCLSMRCDGGTFRQSSNDSLAICPMSSRHVRSYAQIECDILPNL
jgi:hypothetical protein